METAVFCMKGSRFVFTITIVPYSYSPNPGQLLKAVLKMKKERRNHEVVAKAQVDRAETPEEKYNEKVKK